MRPPHGAVSQRDSEAGGWSCGPQTRAGGSWSGAARQGQWKHLRMGRPHGRSRTPACHAASDGGTTPQGRPARAAGALSRGARQPLRGRLHSDTSHAPTPPARRPEPRAVSGDLSACGWTKGRSLVSVLSAPPRRLCPRAPPAPRGRATSVRLLGGCPGPRSATREPWTKVAAPVHCPGTRQAPLLTRRPRRPGAARRPGGRCPRS